MALREVLAQLDIEVRGLGSLQSADASIAKYAQGLRPAVTETEKLRIKQAELGETAARVGQKIRGLQKSEGDHSKTIAELRVAQQRLTASSKSYGAQADKLSGVTQKQTGGLGSLVAGWQGAVAAIGAAVAATAALRAAFGAVADAIGDVIKQGDGIADASIRLGISAGALQEWQFAAERSGVSADAMGRAIGKLTRNAAGPGARALADLGVAARGVDGALRPQEDLFADTLTALASLENGTERAARAQEVFGKSGTELLTLIGEGPAGIATLRERFRELGGGLSNDVVANANSADDALTDFRTSMSSLRSVMVADLLPAVGFLAAGVATIAGGIANVVRHSSAMEAIFGLLAVASAALALVMAPVLLPTVAVVGAIALGLGALFFVVEDVITAFRGGESVFGTFVESMLEGVGVTMTFEGAVDQIGIAWQQAGAIALGTLADIREGIAAVQVGLGLMTPADAARDIGAARARANDATRNVGKSRAVAAGADVSRMIARATPAAAEVASGKAPGGRARRGGGDKMSVQAPITINVQGGDAAATAREIERHHSRRIREAADTLSLAEED